MTSSPCTAFRAARAGFTASATQSSCVVGNAKRGGMTPTTVIDTPLTRSAWPSASARPSKRSCQTRSLTMTTGSAPVMPAASSKSRPSTGRAPSTRKVFGVIQAAR